MDRIDTQMQVTIGEEQWSLYRRLRGTLFLLAIVLLVGALWARADHERAVDALVRDANVHGPAPESVVLLPADTDKPTA